MHIHPATAVLGKDSHIPIVMDPPPGSVSRGQVEEDFAKLRARMQLLNDEFQRLEERNQCVMEHLRYLRLNRLKVVAGMFSSSILLICEYIFCVYVSFFVVLSLL